MGRSPCCDKSKVKKGTWSPEEDATLTDYLYKYGTGGNWIALPHKAGLQRCGKSCRLRWLNYLRPDIKHGAFTQEEEHIICNLYTTIGRRWSVIASHLQGRTDNDVKNYWNSKLKKKLMAPHSRTNTKTPTTTIMTATSSDTTTTTINVNENTIFRTNPPPTSFPVSFPRDNFTGPTNAEAQIPPHGPTNFNLSRLILEGSNCHSSGNKSCHFSPFDDQNSTSPFRPFCLGMDESYGEKEIAMDNEYPCGVVSGFWSQEEAFGGDRNADLFSIFHFDSKSHGVSQSH